MKNEMNGFIIEGRLPGLNQLIDQNRSCKWAGAKLKQETDWRICWEIRKAMEVGQCHKPAGPVRIRFNWHEKNRRRDLDNIFSAKKFILDAMQKTGLIDGDGQKYVVGLEDRFILDKEEMIVVFLIEENQS